MLRGNIDTRLIINPLWHHPCTAGIKRSAYPTYQEYLDHDLFIPAASQGAIIITWKQHSLIRFIEKINDAQTRLCVEMKRHLCRSFP